MRNLNQTKNVKVQILHLSHNLLEVYNYFLKTFFITMNMEVIDNRFMHFCSI